MLWGLQRQTRIEGMDNRLLLPSCGSTLVRDILRLNVTMNPPDPAKPWPEGLASPPDEIPFLKNSKNPGQSHEDWDGKKKEQNKNPSPPLFRQDPCEDKRCSEEEVLGESRPIARVLSEPGVVVWKVCVDEDSNPEENGDPH